MARRAKRDYSKGVYRLLYDYTDLNYFDLVITHSFNGKADGLKSDFVLAQKIQWNDLKDKIKKNKITRAIWFGNREDDYVMPKDVLSGRHAGVIVIKDDIW